MDLLSLIPDNITEVLMKIVRFTELRRRVLYRNMQSVDEAGFAPQDMPVPEFADMLNGAVAEHLQYQRLLFRDTAHIKFGTNNVMQIYPVPDDQALALLQTDRDDYLEHQINKLLENALNRKVAEELLRHKCGPASSLAKYHGDLAVASDGMTGKAPFHWDQTEPA